jgi:trimeric autotransporter adhesin
MKIVIKTYLPFIAFVLACRGFFPVVQAVVPPPDGGYPGGNTAEGQNALFSLTTGANNTAVGFISLRNDTSSGFNTAIGSGALFSNTADANTALGFAALLLNTSGIENTASGAAALLKNTTGSFNTANGMNALYNNTTGNANTANGFQAMYLNPDGSHNTATGYGAFYGGAHSFNTATGSGALQLLCQDYNTATGYSAGAGVGGAYNTATGAEALSSISFSDGNTADGYQALANVTNMASRNIALGFNAGLNLTTGSDNIDIGNQGVAGESNTIRIGTTGTHTNTYVAGIFGATIAMGSPMLVDSAGHIGTQESSQRFKQNIKPMDRASEAILGLKPVTFRYKRELDPAATPQFGLIAEEVAKVNQDLVVRDQNGKIYTVRYDAVNAMLLNEFLKEHKRVQELETTVVQQQRQISALLAHTKEQDSKIQRVSDHLEMRDTTSQVATR